MDEALNIVIVSENIVFKTFSVSLALSDPTEYNIPSSQSSNFKTFD